MKISVTRTLAAIALGVFCAVALAQTKPQNWKPAAIPERGKQTPTAD